MPAHVNDNAHDARRGDGAVAQAAPPASGRHRADARDARRPAGAGTGGTPATAPGGGPLAVPGPSPETEARKRRELRNSKAFATGLLVIATLIYLGCRWLEADAAADGEMPATWIGYVRAASEAGMVGALADWFAVTALFRHPMGIPIPHTAIVRRKKDQVGQSLASFIGDNFLNPALVLEKVRSLRITDRVGGWLVEPGSGDKVSEHVGKFIGNALEAVDPADAEAVIKSAVVDKLAEPEWGPPAGRILGQLIEEGRTEPIIQQLSEWLHRKAQTSHGLIDSMVGERAPSWAPRFVNDMIGDRVHREVVEWTWHVQSDPDHEARQALRRGLEKLARDLREDPTTVARVEELKADLLGSRAVVAAPGAIWKSTSQSLIDSARDPESLLRRKIAEAAERYGHRLNDDAELRASIDRRIEKGAAFLAENYAGEITSIISETVERWDADEASRKIELMVGRDLQFIRVNGTLVGSLAGLAIYTFSTLIFGG
ncbi:DUF445 domain-containing protein [Corynebacterium hansenii]|uniref:DUF445 domain-containing protein n=1 Tax=Corynebacterium hansenii TaxID=394964 RepID=A0ABV7ZM71_9CORY|nr:DUF445 family protein [Corynebacterium hansenii]WJY98904.1 hypothetical protein CHAN_01345 [Corynebacterium hansenii]